MRKFFYFLFFILFSFPVFSQVDSVFHLDSIPAIGENNYNSSGVELLNSWKYHKGDNLEWANPNFSDQSWMYLDPVLDFDSMPANTFENIGWFRLHIEVDTSLIDKTLGLMIHQLGASEIYLDGKLIHSVGKIDIKNIENEQRYNPQIPLDIRFENGSKHLLAVRYSNAKALNFYKNENLVGFKMKIGKLKDNMFSKYLSSNIFTTIFVFYFTFFIALSFLHFTFFIFYRTNKSNLYYSIFAAGLGTYFLTIVISMNFTLPDFVYSTRNFAAVLSDFYSPALLAMLYSIFYKKLPKIFWLWILLFATNVTLSICGIDFKALGYLLMTIFIVESFRIIIASMIKKREGAWIIGIGVITTVGLILFFIILSFFGSSNFHFGGEGWKGFLFGLLAIYATLSIPISMSVYLAKDFAKTSKNLGKKLVEVEELSKKTIEQEKEKQKILETQKETLEIQVKERTAEIVEQKQIIEEKNKDITESIGYAKTIQEAILPSKELRRQLFPDSFILFKPKDIVSGDFYWFTEKDGKRLIASCDCTGHGVPGALMSMMGNNSLNQIVNEKGITKPDAVLNNLHKEIRKSLKQEEQNETKDGMDISLICFNTEFDIEFAGANRPLWIINNNLIQEIKGDKYAIGGSQDEIERKFSNHNILLSKGDCIYIFSDGFSDQFSDVDKKLMTSRFKELLLTIQTKTMLEQEAYLDNFIDNWRGKQEQTDDILVIGIKL